LLGLVVSNITNAFYPELIDAISERAFAAGYTVILGSSAEDSHRQSLVLRSLTQQRVDGVVLTSTLIGGESEIEPFISQGIPMVFANRVNERLEADSVAIDNREGGRIAAMHLGDGGRERIAFIGGRPDTSTNRDKLAGYVQALGERGIAIDSTLVRHGEYTRASGERAVRDLVALAVPFDGIVAADDTIALGCLDALADARLDVPGDVAIVGFDDIDVASLRAVSLTTVSSKAERVGSLAIELLLDRLEGSYAGPPRRVTLPPELVVRRSSSRNGETGRGARGRG
jgi:LacI family transcriptional regulator